MSEVLPRLERRIVDHLDFTFADEAIIALKDMVECPLGLGVGDETIIFNNHCYDNAFFSVILREAIASNISFTDSGYEPDDRRCSRIKDPRTGEIFEYQSAMNNLYFKSTVSRYKLKRILSTRVSDLTVHEVEKFIPRRSLAVNINEFVIYIIGKFEARKVQIEVYQDFLKMRQIDAQSTLPVQVTMPHTWVEPPFPDPPPDPYAPPAPAVLNPNAHARLLVVNDNISISSDYSTASGEDMGIRRVPYGSPSRFLSALLW